LATVIRSRHFDDIGRTRILGFETTALGETLIAIGRQTPHEHLERVLDDLIAESRIDVNLLLDLTARRSGVPGVGGLRRLLAERSSDAYEPPVSELERRLHRLLSDPRIPSATRQLPFDFERVRMTVDVYIHRWRLIVEADGRRWHTRVADFERDRRRDNEAVAHGYAVLRFTHRMLTREPMQCLDTLIKTGAASRSS
jgi:very-short-patch-repair endonuclease